MKKSGRIFFLIYPPYFVTALISVLAFTLFTAQSATRFFLDISSLKLRETGAIVSNALVDHISEPLSPSKLQSYCEKLAAGSLLRITIITPDGLVIADTQAVSSNMDIHLDRQEVREAFATGKGSSIRQSASTGIHTTYEARVVTNSSGKPIALVRVAMPFSIIGERRSVLIYRVLFFGLGLAAVLSLVAYFLSRRITRPIMTIHGIASGYSHGSLEERIPETGPHEIASLAAVMNRMASELDSRIKTIDKQKKQADSILNGMSEAVAVISANLDIRIANPAFNRLFPHEEASGKTDLLSRTRSSEIADFMTMALRTNGPLETGITIYGETPRQLRLTSSPVAEGRAVLVINDLTHLNRLETVRRDFTTNVSHELRTPITAIRAALETIRDSFTDKPEKLKTFVEMALRGCDRLEAILSDLFYLARVEEEENTSMELSPVELDAVIATAVARVTEKNPALSQRIDIQGDKGLVLRGNFGLLEQGLFNLLDNACSYAPQGAITVRVQTQESWVELIVSDHGPGIPERDKDRIFERFYRVDKARSRESGGTGLGLAIVKHIAHAHHGFVSLETAEGKGSTFSIHLPRNHA
ncbi:MAG: HAMP domain-containing protein [Spirochaetales bacterium]|nr:HAMP domain-containing protein [Spirochaetales bacterium]